MERLTKNDLNKVCYDPWEICGMDKHCTKGCHDEGGCTKGCHILKIYRKLAEYEDAEEQGLLLRLPCAIGGTIYKFEYPTKVDENGDEWTIIDKKRATVAPLKFALCHLDSIGKLYYLTREEAEQALAEMQKG